MNKSPNIAALAAALNKVQGQLTPALFDANNPFFKSKYASLSSVFAACRDLLADNGLSVSQFPATPNPGFGPGAALTTLLMHESGEWLEDTLFIPIEKATPQAYGSALTYARRYALSAIIGIVADEDDDGDRAQRPAKKETKKKPQAAVNKPVDKKALKAAVNLATSTGRFRQEIVNFIPHYKVTPHVSQTINLLGFTISDDAETREAQALSLLEYGELRDGGMERDDTLAWMSGEGES